MKKSQEQYLFLFIDNGRRYKQLRITWTLTYQPCSKLASESDAHTTA